MRVPYFTEGHVVSPPLSLTAPFMTCSTSSAHCCVGCSQCSVLGVLYQAQHGRNVACGSGFFQRNKSEGIRRDIHFEVIRCLIGHKSQPGVNSSAGRKGLYMQDSPTERHGCPVWSYRATFLSLWAIFTWIEEQKWTEIIAGQNKWNQNPITWWITVLQTCKWYARSVNALCMCCAWLNGHTKI